MLVRTFSVAASTDLRRSIRKHRFHEQHYQSPAETYFRFVRG